jgi:superfamily II DNA or RNA helicase
MDARDYQQFVIEENLKAMDEGVTATLNGLFTGAGKTVIFCLLAARIAGRTLIICPLRELVWQTIDKVQQVTNLYPEIEMADYHADEDYAAKVIVASKQTLLSRRGGEPRYKRFRDFQLVIVDEAHLMTSAPVVQMLRYFQHDGAMIAGFTATPFRMDGRALMRREPWNSMSDKSATTTSSGPSKTDGPSLRSAR